MVSKIKFLPISILAISVLACSAKPGRPLEKYISPEFFIDAGNTHNKFSRQIKPVLSVPSGSVIKVITKEASHGQLDIDSTDKDVLALKDEPFHPLTGPVYVEGAMPGDVLAVRLHSFQLGDWGWTAISPGYSFLPNEFTKAKIKTFKLGDNKQAVRFSKNINVPLKPFAGVMGVAPDIDELLNTIPPRANGGNLDDPQIVAGTTVYFPVFVEGALFSIGDGHAAQGLGEVAGTGIEAPMTIVYEVNVLKDFHKISEPQYENDELYAVTAFGKTIDEAARKATRYMVDYLVTAHQLDRNEAYMLASLAADLNIAETVNVPHMLVSMSISKSVLGLK